MALTPAEIRHLELKRTLFGYRRGSVDRALEEIVDSFEQVWRERADLADKVEQLEADMVRYRELETLLRTTLISAERASHELKDQARKEAELVVSEAHAEARSITREAAARREQLLAESSRLESMLRSALAAVELGKPEPVGQEAEAA
jgi:cell division initiation protein